MSALVTIIEDIFFAEMKSSEDGVFTYATGWVTSRSTWRQQAEKECSTLTIMATSGADQHSQV